MSAWPAVWHYKVIEVSQRCVCSLIALWDSTAAGMQPAACCLILARLPACPPPAYSAAAASSASRSLASSLPQAPSLPDAMAAGQPHSPASQLTFTTHTPSNSFAPRTGWPAGSFAASAAAMLRGSGWAGPPPLPKPTSKLLPCCLVCRRPTDAAAAPPSAQADQHRLLPPLLPLPLPLFPAPPLHPPCLPAAAQHCWLLRAECPSPCRSCIIRPDNQRPQMVGHEASEQTSCRHQTALHTATGCLPKGIKQLGLDGCC